MNLILLNLYKKDIIKTYNLSFISFNETEVGNIITEGTRVKSVSSLNFHKLYELNGLFAI